MRPYHINGTVEYAVRRTCFPSGSRPRPRCFPCVQHPLVVHCWCATWTRSTRRTRCILGLPMQALCAILNRWMILAHVSHLAATRSTQHPPHRLIGHAVITRNVMQRFPLLDPLEHGCPGRGRDLPARISYGMRVGRQRHQQRLVKGRYERIISGGGSGSVFPVDKQIASSTREEFFQRDACQGRPMVRCPSVPSINSVICSREQITLFLCDHDPGHCW